MNDQKKSIKFIYVTLIIFLFGCSSGVDLASEKERMLETDREFSKMSVEQVLERYAK